MATKLRLQLDSLHVESFEAHAGGLAGRGTVQARSYPSDPNATCDSIADMTCHGYGTCGIYPCKQVP